MRTEREMFALLRGFALSDERIRAMWLNGSRANPDADKDVFMDYDVVCAVTDLAPFVDATDFLQRFGEIAVMQEPEGPPYRENKSRERYAYLMQFADVNRIDLGFVPMETALAEYGKDSQTLLLLDKDGVLPAIPPPSDRDYRVKRPTAQEFAACLGEFRWVAPYVAKGIRRGEPTYAQAQMNGCVRPELLKMLSWKAALASGFQISAGKCGKYLRRYLSQEEYASLLSTYSGAAAEEMWNALFAAFDLFIRSARSVAESLGFDDERQKSQAALDLIRKMKNL